MRLNEATSTVRCRALKALGLALLLVLATPALALLLLPVLLCAAPLALIGLPFLVSALLPELLCASEGHRLGRLQRQLERQARRTHALVARLEP
jgi:hypothetical protein